MNKYLNKVEDVLDGMSDQMEQLNDMEAFLKASFGENLTKAERRDFVRKSVETFVGGIPQIK